MRTAPEGAALWTPAGAYAPDPEMLTHLCFACGRDGGFWCVLISNASLTGPPERLRAGRVNASQYCFAELRLDGKGILGN